MTELTQPREVSRVDDAAFARAAVCAITHLYHIVAEMDPGQSLRWTEVKNNIQSMQRMLEDWEREEVKS